MGAAPSVVSRSGGAWVSRDATFLQDARNLAAALAGYGLTVGAHAAVLGTEGLATLGSHLAVIAAGGTLVPLSPHLSDEALRHALSSTAAAQAIASDERQLARILALRPELPSLDLILLGTAAPSERKPAALVVDSAIAVGAAALEEDPRLLERRADESADGTVCILVDADGGGQPVSHRKLTAVAGNLAKALEVSSTSAVLSALPVDGAVRLAAALAVLGRGAALMLPDPEDRPDAGLDERPPDRILIDRGGLERIHQAWLRDIDAMSWPRRVATRWAVRQGMNDRPGGVKRRVAESVGLRGLRAKLGGKATGLEVVVTPGPRERTDAPAFFSAIALPLRDHDFDGSSSLAR